MSQSKETAVESTSEAVNAVAALVARNDLEGAFRLADESLSKGLIHPALFNARAVYFERAGRNEDALGEFQRARALAPKDSLLLNAIGLCLIRLYRLQEALEVFDEAIRINPAYAPSYQRKGVVLGMCGLPKDAERAHRRAFQLQPNNAEALASLASIAARRGDARTARDYSLRAIRLDPGNPTAHTALALLEIKDGEFDAAERRLRPLLDRPDLVGHGRSVVLGSLADALDGQNRVSEAFAAYTAANDEIRALHAARFQWPLTMTDIVNGLADRLEAAGDTFSHALERRDEPGELEAEQHVFLVGFLRSGTTLLEQVLESHPDIVTLEERDLLTDLADRYLTDPEGLGRLESISGPALETARTQYWQGVDKLGLRVRGKTFVDKHPLNTIKLPLLFKLFPNARILFALRDPRDVVFSCFRRHFEVNAVMYEFLTLEGTAKFYDSVMRVGALSREKLTLNVMDVHYENIVADFEGQIRAVCDFIGVPWNTDMHRFAETARTLDIRSPSAQQVQRGLYASGVEQWRRYSEQLAPVLPGLQRWIDCFGYPAK
jgi:Flp pilus assembly protein TadD